MQQSHQGGATSSGAYRLNPAMCRSFMNSGECSWGDRCKFTHGPSTPRTSMYSGRWPDGGGQCPCLEPALLTASHAHSGNGVRLNDTWGAVRAWQDPVTALSALLHARAVEPLHNSMRVCDGACSCRDCGGQRCRQLDRWAGWHVQGWVLAMWVWPLWGSGMRS